MAKRELRCEIEISFLEGAVFHKMTPEQWKLYSYLWGKAVMERKEDLDEMSSRYLADRTGIPANKIGHNLEILEGLTPKKPLIILLSPGDPTGIHRVSILNVANKHPKLKNIERTSWFNYETNKPLKQKKNKSKSKEKTKEEYLSGVDVFYESIPEIDIKKWKEAYPFVDIEPTIKQSKEWLISNADDFTKRRDSLRGFLTGWLGRANTRREKDGGKKKRTGASGQGDYPEPTVIAKV